MKTANFGIKRAKHSRARNRNLALANKKGKDMAHRVTRRALKAQLRADPLADGVGVLSDRKSGSRYTEYDVH